MFLSFLLPGISKIVEQDELLSLGRATGLKKQKKTQNRKLEEGVMFKQPVAHGCIILLLSAN